MCVPLPPPLALQVWLRYIEWCLTKDDGEAVRKLLERSLACLDRRKHIKVGVGAGAHQGGGQGRGTSRWGAGCSWGPGCIILERGPQE